MRNSIKIRTLAAGLTFAALGIAAPAHAGGSAKNLVAPAFGSYAVTETGAGEWRVCWGGEGKAQRFSGSLHSAGNSAIATKVSLRGVATAQPAANRITFDAAADAHERQCMDVTVTGDHEQLLLDLAINGVEATNPYLVFSTEPNAPDTLLALNKF